MHTATPQTAPAGDAVHADHAANGVPTGDSFNALDWMLRALAACALVGALGGCDRAPDVPTFDPPPKGAPAPKAGASDSAKPS
ncbi:MAG: hypothetical protein EOO31_00045 [Comamonadaceae bacterium]|nr:MAG: hypothetical protein EOO31_00045 [Comamonadaceae bacterium]